MKGHKYTTEAELIAAKAELNAKLIAGVLFDAE